MTDTPPTNDEADQYHIELTQEDIAPTTLLPGNPSRVDKITDFWDQVTPQAHNREFRTATGIYDDTPISVTSTGIGSPSAAIAIEELAELGVSNFIRVGSSGGIQQSLHPGGLVISTGSVRLEGTSDEYVRQTYPAVADHEVVTALVTAAERLGYDYHTGLSASTDSFSVGQGRSGFDGFQSKPAEGIVQELREAGVLNFEMEASALFTLGNLYGLRTGAICTVDSVRGKHSSSKDTDESERKAARTACLATKLLDKMDEETLQSTYTHWNADLSL